MSTDTATAAPGQTHGPGPATHAAETWERPGASQDDDSRPFQPHAEDEIRRTNLYRVGLALVIAFLAPIAGMPGQALAFPQFTALTQMNLATVLMLLPLVAGITLLAMSRRADLPVRGVVTLGLGLLMFILLLVNEDARSSLGRSMSAMPASSGVSGLLFLVAAFGLFISIRLRLYRPLHEYAYLIGAVAAGCYLLYLFIPANGRMPLAQPFDAFRTSKAMGLGMLANVGLMAAAAVICLINTPSTFGWQASNRARRAFLCLVAAVIVPVVMTIFFAMSMSSSMPGSMGMHGVSMGSPAMMFISMIFKFAVMFGGLIMLIPIGIADLLIGRVQD